MPTIPPPPTGLLDGHTAHEAQADAHDADVPTRIDRELGGELRRAVAQAEANAHAAPLATAHQHLRHLVGAIELADEYHVRTGAYVRVGIDEARAVADVVATKLRTDARQKLGGEVEMPDIAKIREAHARHRSIERLTERRNQAEDLASDNAACGNRGQVEKYERIRDDLDAEIAAWKDRDALLTTVDTLVAVMREARDSSSFDLNPHERGCPAYVCGCSRGKRIVAAWRAFHATMAAMGVPAPADLTGPPDGAV